MHEGGDNCLKYLKREWTRREGKERKYFKKGGEQAESRALERGGELGLKTRLSFYEVYKLS